MAKGSFASRRATLLGATMLLVPAQGWAQSTPDSSSTTQQADTSPPPQSPRRDPATSPGDLRDPQALPEDSAPSRAAAAQEGLPQDVVVTGTLVRGVAPPGASPITVDDKYIRSTGSTSVAQILQTIPQLGTFNGFQIPNSTSPEVSTNRPNLRNLPGFDNGGGSTTLVLVDGHRVVGMGNASTSPDPDVLPPNIIERVEIVPDGGSALYGSDAVAGVINFITVRRYNGIKLDGSYGIASRYNRWDANLTVGHDWGSGSIFASYNYAQSGQLLGIDRDYVKQYPNSNGLTSLTCSPGNIETLAGVFGTPAGRVIGLPVGSATVPNQCDSSDYATFYPASQRHSAFAGLTQQLTSGLTFEVRGFYTDRKTQFQNGPTTFQQLLVPQPYTAALQANGVPAISSPFSTTAFLGFINGTPTFVPNSPNTVDLVEQVDGQIPNSYLRSRIELSTWSIYPSFTANLPHGFRARLQTGYGESTATFDNNILNQMAFQNAVTAGLINPFAPSTSNSAALAAVTNYEEYNHTRQRQLDLKATIDGDLFRLPAGAVKIAVGGEIESDYFDTRVGQGVPGYTTSGYSGLSINGTAIIPNTPAVPRFTVSRNIKSAFGEIVAPIFGGGNGPSLTVSAAGRYDSYSDVGDTFNPRVGATFKPLNWISIRGAWGKSFNAPSLADRQDSAVTTAFVLTGASAAFFAPPASLVGTGAGKYPAYTAGLIVAIRGNAPGIQPQKATTYNIGFDVQPPVIPGLNVGASYYNISYNNQIGLPPFETPALVYANYPSVITIAPSQALINSALAQANIIIGPSPVTASTVYAYFDARKRNLGDVRLDGIDMRVNYQAKTGFGNVFVNVNGTYELDRKRSDQPGAALIDVLSANVDRFRIRSSAGAEAGPVLGQLTWNHLSGYKLDPAVGYVPQSHIDAFNTFDLYLRIKLPNITAAHDVALTFNLDNIFDQAPPVYRGANFIAGQQGTPVNAANTIGRFGKIGITTRF